jgi:general secretion pathway protein C
VHVSSSIRQRLRRGLPAAVSAGIWLVSLSITAWLASGWIWDQAAPGAIAPPKVRQPNALEATQAIAARQLMGSPQKSSERASPARPAQYRLIGAMTATGRTRGFAIVAEEGKAPKAVLEGDEVAPGVTLAKVLAEQVQLRHEGHSETIVLSRKLASVPPAPTDISRPSTTANRRQ